MRISVLDVGDGACSILRPSCLCHHVDFAVIDCGSNSKGIRAEGAMNRLLEEIDFRPWDITTIVVTHFDIDHYEGFLHLAQWMLDRNIKFRKLNLIAPRPPEAEREYTAAYLALVSTMTGLRSLDLANALERVTVPGHFFYTPVVRGGPGFLAAHTSFSVHWPPRNLPKRVGGEVLRAMRLYGELADKLKISGFPDLENNMRVAREGNWLNPREGENDVTEIDEEGIDFEPFEGDQVIEEADEHYDDDFSAHLKIPDELLEEFEKAWNAFRRANNNMSIVFDDDDQKDLVVFGDAGAPVLNWISMKKDLANRYAVMLAPHHGSQRLPGSFATQAWVCVSQNGSNLGRYWRKRHLGTHGNFHRCKSTQSGNHHIYARNHHGGWCYY
jgi:hypothetical protein